MSFAGKSDSLHRFSTARGSAPPGAHPLAFTTPAKRDRPSTVRKAQPAWAPPTRKTASKDAVGPAAASRLRHFDFQPVALEPEPKIIWTTSYHTETDIMAAKLARQLPKTCKLMNALKLHVAMVRAEIQPIFDLLASSVAHLTMHGPSGPAEIETLLVRYFADYRETLASFLHDCFADRVPDPRKDQPDREVKDSMRLCQMVVAWNKVHMRHMDILIDQETVIQSYIKQFEALEEENVILKDVLAQRTGAGPARCEVTIRRVTHEPLQRKRQLVDKATDTPEPLLDEPTARVLESIGTETAQAPASASAAIWMTTIASPAFASVLADIRLFNRRTQRRKAVVNAECQTMPIVLPKMLDVSTQTWVEAPVVVVAPSVAVAVQARPESAAVECQVDIPHPAELALEKSKVRVTKLEEQLREAMQKHDETLHAARKDHEAAAESALQQHEAEKKRILRDREQMIEWVQQSELAKTDAINANAILQEKCEQFVVLVDSLRSDIIKLTEDQENLQRNYHSQSVTLEETDRALTDLRAEHTATLAFQSVLQASATLLQSELTETKQLLSTASTAAREWEEKALAAQDAESSAANKAERAVEDATYARDGTQKLVDGSLELERMLQVADAKCKEVTSCLNAVMKYPDVSLGHDISMADVGPATGGSDRVLKDMITGNSVRISLLEQKNNELRVLRLKLAASAQSPMTTPILSASLIDNPAVQRATEAAKLHFMEQQASVRGSGHPSGYRPPNPSAQKQTAQSRPATQSAWNTLKASLTAPPPVSKSLTKYPPEGYVGDDFTAAAPPTVIPYSKKTHPGGPADPPSRSGTSRTGGSSY
ncbi:hypothetical protein HDU87_003624 [Geranomyces variabilis]|uniref:Uncharacterized protein n=1 Tax=Geranomyces variabilis TaxID=109894 RepID=A0AAD5XMD6_9FUNG|nr:hypothetical protein HDU87_003624 [Geranomyces variabilis]